MSRNSKKIKIGLSLVCGAFLVLVVLFVGIYASRLATMASIEKITNRTDGYDLYRMDVKYDYNLNNLVGYGLDNDQKVMDAIIKEALPFLPVKVSPPDFSCSAFSLKTVDGKVLMGRNYDFATNTSAMLVFNEPVDGYRSVAFAALSNLSTRVANEKLKSKFASLAAPFVALDGMNEKGVSIAVLTLDTKPTVQNTGKPNIATSSAIRLVLDKAASTQQAVDLLKGYDMISTANRDYHFYINDASGDGRVVEYDFGGERRELVDTKTRSVTNFFIKYIDKYDEKQDELGNRYGHGKDRYDKMEEVFENANGDFTKTVAWQALKTASQEPGASLTSNTQWSIVFNNSDLTLEFALRRNWDEIIQYDLKTNRVSFKSATK